MPRHITVTAQYMNGKTTTYGVYNKFNAEYKKSLINVIDFDNKLDELIKDIHCKRVRKVWCYIDVSTGNSFETLPTLKFDIPSLDCFVDPAYVLSLVNIVNNMYKAYK